MADPLARFVRHDPPTGQAARERNRRVYAALWHKFGVVAVDPADIMDDWIRQAFINEAVKQYGGRDDG